MTKRDCGGRGLCAGGRDPKGEEWKGASARSLGVMTLGLTILIGATVVIGAGNMLVVRG